ncbi:[protein-PII] uridylyltransferase [Kiloniella sp. b19]|uniref:[protein-PII] uridylyltransferase n=1 Tax=Kiloniella sp. GXU_MW_B19 TaxID=3141326 RepID=UPI0031E122A3
MLKEAVSHPYEQDVPNRERIIDSIAVQAQIEMVQDNRDLKDSQRRGEILKILKETLKAGREEVKQRFEQKTSGTVVVKAHCYLMDQIVLLLYRHVNEFLYPASLTKGEHLSLVAVGGYGRGELAPHSDVDLLFLMPYKKTARTEQIVESILYFLWDLNIKVGQSVRTVNECIKAAQGDITISTSLLEGRYLIGDERLYRALHVYYERNIQSRMENEFIEQKLAERRTRHSKQGVSRYTLEPNIKDGKGGLRDLQTLFWIAKFLYKVNDIRELVSAGVFTKKEVRKFEKAQDFLWSLRCALHYLTNRPDERLSFDVQRELAVQMHYTDHAGTRGVERFMKHYFIVAKDVGNLTRIFCAALEADHNRRSRFRLPLTFLSKKRTVEGFALEGDRVSFRARHDLKENPLDILKIFHVAQKNKLDIHPDALRYITQSLKLLNKTFRENEDAQKLFLAILTDPNEPALTLRRMNEAGVLGQFIPDFGKVVALMQFNMYHSYTVDEHTIFTIDVLTQIERGDLSEAAPIATEVIHKVQSRRALYVAMLLHDIAKGRPGDHSVEGAKVALRLCPKLGLSPEETETVSWLVRYHLTMSETAFSRDIDDPQTIQDFAEIVQSPERLRLLLVLTVADIRGVGPTVWNGWKAALLRDLYWRTESLLSGEHAEEGRQHRIQATIHQLQERLEEQNWTQKAIKTHIKRGTDSYWLSTDTSAQVRHARMMKEVEDKQTLFALRTYVDRYRQITEVTLYAGDHPGLFSRLAGTLALYGCSIEGATIYTLRNGMALDTFYVVDSMTKDLIDDPERLQKLEENIERSLTGELKQTRQLADMAHHLPSRIHKAIQVTPRVIIDNNASQHYTVIEVNGKDRTGLLFDLTKALTKMGLLIHSARISTYGLRAVDVFYVETALGEKITSHQKRTAVLKKLMSILE